MYRTRARVKQLGVMDNMSANKTKSGNVDRPSTHKKVELSPTWTDVANAELARASHAHSHPSGARPKTLSKGGGGSIMMTMTMRTYTLTIVQNMSRKK